MPFEKGKSGNPNGRSKDKWFYEALRVATSAEDRVALRKIAEKLVSMAVDGDMQAITAVRDTLDGKPVQQTENKTTLGVDESVTGLLDRIAENGGKLFG